VAREIARARTLIKIHKKAAVKYRIKLFTREKRKEKCKKNPHSARNVARKIQDEGDECVFESIVNIVILMDTRVNMRVQARTG
jgi:hypothetical protein